MAARHRPRAAGKRIAGAADLQWTVASGQWPVKFSRAVSAFRSRRFPYAFGKGRALQRSFEGAGPRSGARIRAARRVTQWIAEERISARTTGAQGGQLPELDFFQSSFRRNDGRAGLAGDASR